MQEDIKNTISNAYERITKRQEDLEDYLTSLYNKNYFIKHMDTFFLNMINGIIENKKNNNNDKTWSILFCDIDGLKLTNDTMGHAEADEGIAHIASIVKQSIRTNRDEVDNILYPKNDSDLENIPIRFGGDEFIVFLPNCTKEKAILIHDRIKNRINHEKDKTKNMTLSIGIADTSEVPIPNNISDANAPKEFINNLIKLAEKRMYADKNRDINTLSDEEKKLFVMKHLNRMASQIGFDASDPEQLSILIDLMIEMKESIKTK